MSHVRDTTDRHPLRLGLALWLAVLPGGLVLAATPATTTFLRSFEPAEPAPLANAPDPRFNVAVAGGPDEAVALTARPSAGFSGLHSLHYRGDAGGQQQVALYAVNLPVRADTQLSP